MEHVHNSHVIIVLFAPFRVCARVQVRSSARAASVACSIHLPCAVARPPSIESLGCVSGLGVYSRLLFELYNIYATCFTCMRHVGTRCFRLWDRCSQSVSSGSEM